MAEIRPIYGREVRLGPKSSSNFFYRERAKIDDFIEKKLRPHKNVDFMGV